MRRMSNLTCKEITECQDTVWTVHDSAPDLTIEYLSDENCNFFVDELGQHLIA